MRDAEASRRSRARQSLATIVVIAVNIVLDEASYPFLLQGFRAGSKAEHDLRDLFRRMSTIAERAAEQGTVHVVVALGDENFSAAERRVVADCMAKATPEEAARVVGAFAVIESGFARGVLTALRWLAPQVIPVIAASTPDEAIDLAAARLREVGVDVPLTVDAQARAHARALHSRLRGGGERGP